MDVGETDYCVDRVSVAFLSRHRKLARWCGDSVFAVWTGRRLTSNVGIPNEKKTLDQVFSSYVVRMYTRDVSLIETMTLR